MAITPNIDIHQALEPITMELDRIDTQLNRYRMIVASIDTQLRETLSLASEVAAAQLELIEELQGIPPKERRIEKIEESLNVKLAGIRDDYLVNYRSFLKEREGYMEDGKQIVLTEEKRENLYEHFANTLDEKFEKSKKEHPINENTDLKKAQERLEEAFAMKQECYNQLDEEKNALALEVLEKQEEVDPLYKELLNKKKALFEKGLKVRDLYLASQFGDIDFIKKVSGLKKKVNQLNASGFAPLHYAAYHNRLETIKQLILGGANYCVQDASGNQPIHWAAKQGNYPIVATLIQSNPEEVLNAKGEYGRTPLHRSVFNGRIETTLILLHRGANPNLSAEGDGGVTPLHHAVEQRNSPMIEALLTSSKLDVMKGNNKGDTPLHWAIAMGLEEITSLLISHKSFFSYQEGVETFDTLITLAKKENHLNILRTLLLHDIHQKILEKQEEKNQEINSFIKEKEKLLKKQKIKPEEVKKQLSLLKEDLLKKNATEIAEYEEAAFISMKEKLNLV